MSIDFSSPALLSQMSIDYSSLQLLRYLAAIVVFAHWMACLYCMLLVLEDNRERSWLTVGVNPGDYDITGFTVGVNPGYCCYAHKYFIVPMHYMLPAATGHRASFLCTSVQQQ